MKTVYICKDCGSENVQGKAWVDLNDLTKIDFSLSESGDSEDFWCENCQDHTYTNLRTFYVKDEEVNWVDPENISSGIYKIIEKKTEDEEDSIYLISNGTSEAEAYEFELTPVKT